MEKMRNLDQGCTTDLPGVVILWKKNVRGGRSSAHPPQSNPTQLLCLSPAQHPGASVGASHPESGRHLFVVVNEG